MLRILISFALATAALCGAAAAQQADGVIRIGFINDLSGPTSGTDGKNAVVAAQMAVEDAGLVLGKEVVFLSADHQNKPEVGAPLVRRWFEQDKVDAVFDVNNSPVALAVQDLAKELDRIAVYTAAASSDLTGKACSPNGFHWLFDTYSQTVTITDTVVAEGSKNWFYLVVDYTFGQLMFDQSSKRVEAGGGKVVGSVKHPLNSSDFASYILQAQAANPDVLAFANSVHDMVTALKQAREFGVQSKMVAFFFSLQDAHGLGLEAVQGVRFLDSFYWDLDDQTRAWSKRFHERTGVMPTSQQAGAYSAVAHYLKAVAAAGTDETQPVLAKMKSTPVEDFMTKAAPIRADGRVMRDMYLLEVKTPAESAGEWDYFKVLATVPGEKAFLPADQSPCALLKG